MDAIYKQAEDDIIGFVTALPGGGSAARAQGDLEVFVQRLKRRILKNPTVFVAGD